MNNIFLIHQILEKAARNTPDAPAVEIDSTTITYRELDLASNAIAQSLAQQGVKPKDRIGILLEKSIGAVVSIYGILKTGACYVPLDIHSPSKRSIQIINDCQMKLVITLQKHLSKLEPHREFTSVQENGLAIYLLEFDSSNIYGTQVSNAPTDLTETDLAYILYTSGSTGTPKGVMLSHRAGLSFIKWAVDYFHPKATDRFSSHAPFHFDLSIFDLFVAASVGACVCLIPPIITIFPRSLVDWIKDTKITFWYSAPSALVQLVINGEITENAGSTLRHIIFAGEVFPGKHFVRLRELLPAAKYHNLYGPTETNVCTVYTIPDNWRHENSAELPIGKPCTNMQVFALNNKGRRIEKNEIGELLVQGPGVMSGYWGNIGQTEKVFHSVPGYSGRMYHTGDLVKLDDQMNFIFIGRKDHQIKRRGYRIEIGEIESILLSMDSVTGAVVVPTPDENFGNLLHAFLVFHLGHPISEQDMYAYCKEHLPSYMIPDKFYHLDELPMTSTDKIDRAKLAKSIKEQMSYE